MKTFDKSRADFFYGMWVAVVIGVVVALSINLVYLYQKIDPQGNELIYMTEVSLVGALVGLVIHFIQGFIIYLFRNVKNKHIMGITLFVSSYVLTYLIIFAMGYSDNRTLSAVSLIPSIWGTIFAYFEIRRITKLNCGLQKKKEELSKKINTHDE